MMAVLVASLIIAGSLVTIGVTRFCCNCPAPIESALEKAVEVVVEAETGIDIAPMLPPYVPTAKTPLLEDVSKR